MQAGRTSASAMCNNINLIITRSKFAMHTTWFQNSKKQRPSCNDDGHPAGKMNQRHLYNPKIRYYNSPLSNSEAKQWWMQSAAFLHFCLIQVHIFSASSPKYSKFTFTSPLWGKNAIPSTLFPHEFNLCSLTVGERISHLQKTASNIILLSTLILLPASILIYCLY